MSEIEITTPDGECIRYTRGESGYWSATQQGMPDHWYLSRVASRAVDELIRQSARLSELESALASARQDVERLEWLSERWARVEFVADDQVRVTVWRVEEISLREELDAEMSGEGPPPNPRAALSSPGAEPARRAVVPRSRTRAGISTRGEAAARWTDRTTRG